MRYLALIVSAIALLLSNTLVVRADETARASIHSVG